MGKTKEIKISLEVAKEVSQRLISEIKTLDRQRLINKEKIVLLAMEQKVLKEQNKALRISLKIIIDALRAKCKHSKMEFMSYCPKGGNPFFYCVECGYVARSNNRCRIKFEKIQE